MSTNSSTADVANPSKVDDQDQPQEVIPTERDGQEAKAQEGDEGEEEIVETTQSRGLWSKTARGDRFQQQAALALPGDVILLSGCRDHETSAGVVNVGAIREAAAGKAGGVCTSAILDALEDSNANLSWKELLDRVRAKLKAGNFMQVPQLSISRPKDLAQEKFAVVHPEHNDKSHKRALLIGINYVGCGSDVELFGCITDVMEVKAFLEKQGYNEFRLLTDANPSDVESFPNITNIMEGFRWLRSGLGENSSCFVHFSGHGSQDLDKNGDEADGKDECLIPLDYFANGGIITDDQILKELVLPFPEHSKLTCLFDCCHSGTLLDLPYSASTDRGVTLNEAVQNERFHFSRLLEIVKSAAESASDTLTGGFKNLMEFVKSFGNVFPI